MLPAVREPREGQQRRPAEAAALVLPSEEAATKEQTPQPVQHQLRRSSHSEWPDLCAGFVREERGTPRSSDEAKHFHFRTNAPYFFNVLGHTSSVTGTSVFLIALKPPRTSTMLWYPRDFRMLAAIMLR